MVKSVNSFQLDYKLYTLAESRFINCIVLQIIFSKTKIVVIINIVFTSIMNNQKFILLYDEAIYFRLEKEGGE